MKSHRFVAQWMGLAALTLALVGSSSSPMTWAQSTVIVYLPLLIQSPPYLHGQALGITHLASEPSLLLLTVGSIVLPPQAARYVPWLSEDGGAHWRQPASMPWMLEPVLSTTRDPDFALVDSEAGPVLVTLLTAQEDTWEAKGYSSVFVSTDRGASWTRYPFETAEGCTVLKEASLVVSPAEPRVLYAQGYCPDPDDGMAPAIPVLLRSSDYGVHWETLAVTIAGHPGVQFSPVQAGLWYASRPDGGYWRTTDAGGHWLELGPAPGGSLVLSPTDPTRLLSTRQQGAFLSFDGGESWRALNGQPLPFSRYYVSGWEIGGSPPVDVFPCAGTSWITTQDAGRTWQQLTPAPFDVKTLHSARADAIMPGRLWVFTLDGQVSELWTLDLTATPQWTHILRMEHLP